MYLYKEGSPGINVPFEVPPPTRTSELRFHPNHPGRHLQVELLRKSEEEGRKEGGGGGKEEEKRGGKVGKVVE